MRNKKYPLQTCWIFFKPKIGKRSGKRYSPNLSNKKANLMQKLIIEVVMAGFVFAIFLYAISGRVNSRDVKQQVLEKQTALLIDSAMPGMTFSLNKVNVNGYIDKIEIKQGRVFVYVEGIKLSKGYPYFTRYSVELEEDEDKFYINVVEK